MLPFSERHATIARIMFHVRRRFVFYLFLCWCLLVEKVMGVLDRYMYTSLSYRIQRDNEEMPSFMLAAVIVNQELFNCRIVRCSTCAIHRSSRKQRLDMDLASTKNILQ